MDEKYLRSSDLRDIDRRIASDVFGWTVYQCENTGWRAGENIYLVDERARETEQGTTIVSLLGGDWITGRFADGHEQRFFGRIVPHYTTDIDAAMEIISKLNPWSINLTRFRLVPEDSGCVWRCSIEPGMADIQSEAATMELAICLAALKYMPYRDRGQRPDHSVRNGEQPPTILGRPAITGELCDRCGQVIASNWIIRHRKNNCRLGVPRHA